MSSLTDLQREYKRGYSKGYETGRRNQWPEKLRLPDPPEEFFARILRAAKACRDAMETYRQTVDEDDELAQEFIPLIDEFDDATLEIIVELTK